MNKPRSWDATFIEIARVMAGRSKDPHTRVGACLVSPDKRTVAVGYNGFPVGVADTVERWQRPVKYAHVIHAEMNALLHAKTNVAGWTLYVTAPPCSECMKHLVQAGVDRILFLPTRPLDQLTTDFAFEAGIGLTPYVEQ